MKKINKLNYAVLIISIIIFIPSFNFASGNSSEKQFFDAINKGNFDSVKSLIENGADVNAGKNKTPMMMAAYRGESKIVQLLLEYKADPNAKDRAGRTALHYGIDTHKNSYDIVKLLLDHKADANIEYKNTALLQAVKKKKNNIVQLLLEYKADPNFQNSVGQTALMIATQNGNRDLVKLLISNNNADVNIEDNEGRTPLIVASEGGHIEIVKVLVKNEADINILPKKRGTALANALRRKHVEIALYLIENGADTTLNSKYYYDEPVFIYAVRSGDYDIVRSFIEKKADVNIVDTRKENALMNAVGLGHYKIAELLLENGADVHSKKHGGMTLLMIAAKRGKIEMVRLLLGHGEDPNTQDKNGQTALFHATSGGRKNADIVKLLLEHKAKPNDISFLSAISNIRDAEIIELYIKNGADVNAKETSGFCRTALMNAAYYGNLNIINLLIKHGADLNTFSCPGKYSGGSTALMLAANRDHFKAVKLLVGNGAKIDIKNSKGESITDQNHSVEMKQLLQWLSHKGEDPLKDLVYSIEYHDMELIESLLNKGVNINEVFKGSKAEYTPLAAAAYFGHADIVRILISKGADVQPKGLSPMKMAEQRGHKEIINILKQYDVKSNVMLWSAIEKGDLNLALKEIKNGADVNAKIYTAGQYQYHTPLMVASIKGHSDIAKVLIKNGADVNSFLSHNGATALHFAVFHRHLNIVKLLINEGADIQAQMDSPFGTITPLQYAEAKNFSKIYYTLKKAGAKTSEELLKSNDKHAKSEYQKKKLVEKNKRFLKKLKNEFILIKSGTFMMGSPEDEPYRDNDEKQHKVTLTKDFYLQKTEVTQAQWETVMGNNPSKYKGCGKNCPVDSVSWNDVQKFIKKLNDMDDKAKYRLPTEAEWEYAARASTTTICFFGNDKNKIGEYVWYQDNPNNPIMLRTNGVGQKKPNDWGLYDVYGNVSEWCQDKYNENYYKISPLVDPICNSEGKKYVVRGGGFFNFVEHYRSANRSAGESDYRHGSIGFRLVYTR